jgi:hypothetical protein
MISSSMSPPQKPTWKSSIWLSFFVCYGPFSWVLFISENRILWVKMWPLLPGLPVVMVLQQLIHWQTSALVFFTASALVSFGMFLVVLNSLGRISGWRCLTGGVATTVMLFLSWIAYGLFRA